MQEFRTSLMKFALSEKTCSDSINLGSMPARTMGVLGRLEAARARVFRDGDGIAARLGGQAHQPPEQGSEFPSDWGSSVSGFNFLLQAQATQRFTAIRV